MKVFNSNVNFKVLLWQLRVIFQRRRVFINIKSFFLMLEDRSQSLVSFHRVALTDIILIQFKITEYSKFSKMWQGQWNHNNIILNNNNNNNTAIISEDTCALTMSYSWKPLSGLHSIYKISHFLLIDELYFSYKK